MREILYRPRYRGELIWNRVRKRDGWGLKKYLERPESEWLRRSAIPAARPARRGEDPEGRYYEFAGQGALDKLLTGIIRPSSVVTPAGYDRPWTVEIHGLVRAS